MHLWYLLPCLWSPLFHDLDSQSLIQFFSSSWPFILILDTGSLSLVLPPDHQSLIKSQWIRWRWLLNTGLQTTRWKDWKNVFQRDTAKTNYKSSPTQCLHKITKCYKRCATLAQKSPWRTFGTSITGWLFAGWALTSFNWKQLHLHSKHHFPPW